MTHVVTFSVGILPCANGETHEFFLCDEHGRRLFGGVGVFRTVEAGDHLPTHAWQAFREMVLDKHVHQVDENIGVTSAPLIRNEWRTE